LNPFMRAHRHLPGPTQRPIVTGLLAGTVALVPALAWAWRSGAVSVAAKSFGLSAEVAAIAIVVAAPVAGALYGLVFMRTANDHRGGWLFGIGFGFLLWMAGSGAMFLLLVNAPIATGRASQIVFASHLLYGLILGLTLPHVCKFVQHRSLWIPPRGTSNDTH
jgi:hypothetical protein